MNIIFLPKKLPRLGYLLFGAFETIAFVAAFSGAGVSAASCTAPATDYGMDVVQQNVTGSGTYTIWSHIYAPTGSTGSYLLEVDGPDGSSTCYSVGGSYVPLNTWKWVDTDTSSSTISTNLSAGNYTFKLIGNAPSVKLDSILLTTDASCTPQDGTDGSNCSAPASPPDTTGGTATPPAPVTAPSGSAGTSGDNSGNSGGTGDSGSDQGSADSGGSDGGGFGNSFSLNAPTDVSAGLGALDSTSLSYPVTVSWSTTDGATGYDIVLDGTTIDEVNSGGTTSYDYMLPADGSTHTFQVIAFDDSGDVSDLSDGATVDASLSGDTSGNATVTAPTSLQAVPSGKAKQVNLTWADDDPSVKSYVIYRGDGSDPGGYTKVGTSKTTTYGDTTVKAGSTYSYYIVAVNAGGDQSDQSSSANVTVSASQASGGIGKGGTVIGKVRGSDGHKPVIGARVTFTLSGKTYVFTTNGDGVYVIPNMSSGPYTVSFSAPGYKASSSTIQINASMATHQNITLARNGAGGSSAWKHWDFWNYL